MEKSHFDQAKLWLKGAIYIADHEGEDRDKYSVAVAMLVHAVIKANDALTFKFLNTTARRHDDARRLFEDLIRRNILKPEFSSYKEIIQEAINNKAKAEYRISFFSKNDFESFKRKAEKFLKMAEECIFQGWKSLKTLFSWKIKEKGVHSSDWFSGLKEKYEVGKRLRELSDKVLPDEHLEPRDGEN